MIGSREWEMRRRKERIYEGRNIGRRRSLCNQIQTQKSSSL